MAFAFWTPEEVKSAILRMEKQLTTGASQIASPTEGSATLLSRSQADVVIERLYRAYEAKTGEKIVREQRETQVKTYQINVVKDYWQR